MDLSKEQSRRLARMYRRKLGLRDRDIADQLSIAPSTYSARIQRGLDRTTRWALVGMFLAQRCSNKADISAHSRAERPEDAASTASPASIRRRTRSAGPDSVAASSR